MAGSSDFELIQIILNDFFHSFLPQLILKGSIGKEIHFKGATN